MRKTRTWASCRRRAASPPCARRPVHGSGTTGERNPGGEVPIYYDPLISKLSAWGPDRPRAIARMTRALREYEVLGIQTTVPFFRWMLAQPAFLAAEFHTAYLDELLQQRGGEPFATADEDRRGRRGGAAALHLLSRETRLRPTSQLVRATHDAKQCSRGTRSLAPVRQAGSVGARRGAARVTFELEAAGHRGTSKAAARQLSARRPPAGCRRRQGRATHGRAARAPQLRGLRSSSVGLASCSSTSTVAPSPSRRRSSGSASRRAPPGSAGAAPRRQARSGSWRRCPAGSPGCWSRPATRWPPAGAGGRRSDEDGKRAALAARRHRQPRCASPRGARRGERSADRDRVRRLSSAGSSDPARYREKALQPSPHTDDAAHRPPRRGDVCRDPRGGVRHDGTVDLGPSLKARAEQAASDFMGRPMHIGRLSVHLWLGRFVLEDLVIEGLDAGGRGRSCSPTASTSRCRGPRSSTAASSSTRSR